MNNQITSLTARIAGCFQKDFNKLLLKLLTEDRLKADEAIRLHGHILSADRIIESGELDLSPIESQVYLDVKTRVKAAYDETFEKPKATTYSNQTDSYQERTVTK